MPLDPCWLPLNPSPSPSALWHCSALCRRWGSCAFVGTKGERLSGRQDQRGGQWRVAPGMPESRARDEATPPDAERELLSWSPLGAPCPTLHHS